MKEQAGPRYTPKLNVDLPIAEIFDGLSRTRKFYTEIRKHYGTLNRNFQHVSPKYENASLQATYDDLRCEISKLTKLLSGLTEYNSKEIPWSEVNHLARKAEAAIWEFSNKLNDEGKKAESEKTSATAERHSLGSERIEYALREIQEELRYLEELSSSAKAKLSNNPFLFLTGVAGTGKTHLLCDVVESRFISGESLPAVVAFGENFVVTEDPFNQIIRQLDLTLNRNEFLRTLNDAGKKSACRALIVIDALNETEERSFWKRNLGEVASEVKKYPNLGLVISIRSGFEEEVLTEEQMECFVREEHWGFQFREWEAVNKFFQEFQIPMPEIPLFLPEFQNPLFLLLFCKAFQARGTKKKGKKDWQIFRGHEGATYIFETFVKRVADRVASGFKLPMGKNHKGEYVIWDTVIEKIAEKMVHQGSDRIAEEKVAEVVKTAHPSVDCEHFILELERNLLLVKVPRYSKDEGKHEGFDYRFPFQKFSDHLIGRYIFKRFEKESGSNGKNLETAKRFFSEPSEFGKLLARTWDRGIIEALSIQCPEHLKGCELVDVAPYLRDVPLAQEALVESLIWRKPTAFSADRQNTLTYINSVIFRTEHGRDGLFNALLAVAPIPNHPFNSDRLHQHLSKFSMAKRDAWWSIFLHRQHGTRGSVDRLIKWGWSEHDKTYITDDAVRLYAIALSWFLTTPNRFLRDKATKALAALLTGKLNVVLALLKKFKGVNDPYVAERLYAVAYGCALRSSKDGDGLKALSKWVYNEVFKHGNPPEHILLRDHARGIIEVALKHTLSLRLPKKKVQPPYKSRWISRFPTNETIKSYLYDHESDGFKDHFWAQNSMIYSMQPEYSEITSIYGDFGRYTFQMALSDFSYPDNVTMQKLSNWVIKRVLELGYDVNLHGTFDRNLNRHLPGRSEPKAERIGKKYQWIALHELLARVSDKFEIKYESWTNRTEKYEGPWQLTIRDIDPSCILKEFPNKKSEDMPDFVKNKIQDKYTVWRKISSDFEWLKKTNDLPDSNKVIEFVDDQGNAWLALQGFFEWREETPPEEDEYSIPTRTLWYMVNSYLVRSRDYGKVFTWAKRQRFMGQWMPRSRAVSDVYLGEYPWAAAFLHHNIPYYGHDGWTNGDENKKIPAQILVADDQYVSRGSSIDCSTNEVLSVRLLAKFIVDEMNVVQSYIDGRFFDRTGNLVAFDPSVFDSSMPKSVLMRKDKLLDFLRSKGYALFWTFIGEKNLIYGGMEQPLGWLEINGAYTLSDKGEIKGKKRSRWKAQ